VSAGAPLFSAGWRKFIRWLGIVFGYFSPWPKFETKEKKNFFKPYPVPYSNATAISWAGGCIPRSLKHIITNRLQ
jgi:hypothetical protein